MRKSFLIRVFLIALLVWGEVGGVYHAVKHHSDGVMALFVPPVAWYRSIEMFFHQDYQPQTGQAAPSDLAPVSTSAAASPAVSGGILVNSSPPPSDLEMSEWKEIADIAKSRPLNELDVSRYLDLLKHYKTRTGAQPWALQYPVQRGDDLQFAYLQEIVHSIQATAARHVPTFTPKFEQLQQRLKTELSAPESSLARDREFISSAASSRNWQDANGTLHRPVRASDLEPRLRRAAILQVNMQRLRTVSDDFK